MMLQDHFRPPLSVRRHWHAFHNAWATYIASDLNSKLPEGYFAEPNVQFGIEIDVAAFEDSWQESKDFTSIWMPPPPNQTIAFLPTDETIEVNIFNVVKDNTGSVIATGELGQGKSIKPNISSEMAKIVEQLDKEVGHGSTLVCQFPILVKDVPKSNFYTIEVGRRGDMTYKFEELQQKKWQLELSLG